MVYPIPRPWRVASKLTVRENISFSARKRMPSGTSNARRKWKPGKVPVPVVDSEYNHIFFRVISQLMVVISMIIPTNDSNCTTKCGLLCFNSLLRLLLLPMVRKTRVFDFWSAICGKLGGTTTWAKAEYDRLSPRFSCYPNPATLKDCWIDLHRGISVAENPYIFDGL